MMSLVALAPVVGFSRVGFSLESRMNFGESRRDRWGERTKAQIVRGAERAAEVELNICEEEGERWDGLA
jgi:hypothetical protein